MTKLIPLLVAVAVLAAVAVGASAAAHPTVSAASAASCPTVTDGQLTIGTDNPAYPPWYAGGTKSSKWKINDPATGKGYESAVAYAIASKLGYTKSHGLVDVRAVQPRVCTRVEVVRLRHQPDLVHARAREGRRLQQVVLRREPGDRRQQGHEDRVGPQHQGPGARTSSALSSARRATRSSRVGSSRRSSRPSTTRTRPPCSL